MQGAANMLMNMMEDSEMLGKIEKALNSADPDSKIDIKSLR
jgi:hypothetical protein